MSQVDSLWVSDRLHPWSFCMWVTGTDASKTRLTNTLAPGCRRRYMKVPLQNPLLVSAFHPKVVILYKLTLKLNSVPLPTSSTQAPVAEFNYRKAATFPIRLFELGGIVRGEPNLATNIEKMKRVRGMYYVKLLDQTVIFLGELWVKHVCLLIFKALEISVLVVEGTAKSEETCMRPISDQRKVGDAARLTFLDIQSYDTLVRNISKPRNHSRA